MKAADSFARNYLYDAVSSFENYRRIAEKALEQVTDEEFFHQPDPESNSHATIVKHMAGNQLSRWTDFLTTDGEKSDRNRDSEFEHIGESRETLMKKWQKGWHCLFQALKALEPNDFQRRVRIRGQEHTVIEAVNRQLAHNAYHIGQIVYISKRFRSSEWQTLSVPRNMSREFNAFLAERGKKAEGKVHHLRAGEEFLKKH